MAYLGRGPQFLNPTVYTNTGDNTTTSFALGWDPGSQNGLVVFLDGVNQKPGTDFSVSGSNIIFSPAPATGVSIVVYGVSVPGVVMRFLISSLIFFFLQLPMIVASFPIVAVMLLTKWDGTTTWFGNFKYGRGDTHYKSPSEGVYWKHWRFLCIRNPVSNFGKRVLAVKDAPWVWLYDRKIVGNFYWKYGWKNPNPESPAGRTFVYRPWFHK